MKRMVSTNTLIVSLLLTFILINICACSFNIYLPTEQPIPEHIHNQDRLVQDGEEGHHWECTLCNLATDIEAHDYDSDGCCSVCGYEYNQGKTGSGGFEVNIIYKVPMGHINAQFDTEKKKWVFKIVDDRSKNSQKDYPITKFTWYVFDEKKSTDSSFELETPYEISYQICCEFGNNYGFADSTVVITGRTE